MTAKTVWGQAGPIRARSLGIPFDGRPGPLNAITDVPGLTVGYRTLVGGDAAGFPNGRRIGDDVVTIELRAVAGLTIPLVDPSFTPDGAAAAVEDGTTDTNAPLLDVFPFLGHPAGGYQVQPGTVDAS